MALKLWVSFEVYLLTDNPPDLFRISAVNTAMVGFHDCQYLSDCSVKILVDNDIIEFVLAKGSHFPKSIFKPNVPEFGILGTSCPEPLLQALMKESSPCQKEILI